MRLIPSDRIFLVLALAVCGLFLVHCSTSYSEGDRLYQQYCAACHMEDGQGLRQLYPPLDQADYALNNYDFLACIIHYGLEDTIEVNGVRFQEKMSGIPHLTDTDIANIINFVNKSFLDGKGDFVSPGDVRRQLDNCNE